MSDSFVRDCNRNFRGESRDMHDEGNKQHTDVISELVNQVMGEKYSLFQIFVMNFFKFRISVSVESSPTCSLDVGY